MAMVETGGPDTSRMLAGQAFADDDLQACRRHAEAAFRGYSRSRRSAVGRSMAMLLATLHGGSLGNQAAGQGWLERARRTLEMVGPCVEWGYLELAVLACDRPDAIELVASAERALDHRPRVRRSRPRGAGAGRRRAGARHPGPGARRIRAARRGDGRDHRRRGA